MKIKKELRPFTDAAPNALKLFDRNRISKGDVVKIMCSNESVNVELKRVLGEMCEGVVTNTIQNPIFLGFDKRDDIRFSKKHIHEIVEKNIN